MRSRQYMTELVGGGGNVLTHHITRAEFEKKLEQAQFKDKENVKKFLDNLTFDEQGSVYIFVCASSRWMYVYFC